MKLAHYCTYFDHRYLPRGLALYASMRRHCEPFRLWVLCLSEECYEALRRLDLRDVVPLRLAELELRDRPFAASQHDRSRIEYYFSSTPALMVWLLETNPSIDVLTYLDADLYFFASPNFLFHDFEAFSTLIVPHRFSRRNEALRNRGLYNVGWVSFRRDPDGLACLQWWREACIEWCRDVVEDDRYCDQKYLDEFPRKFARVQVAEHPGVNLAPWNLDNYRLSRGADSIVRVDSVAVVFFHFHALRRIAGFLWRTPHPLYGTPLDRRVRSWLYAPYLAELAAAERQVRGHAPKPAWTGPREARAREGRPLARLRKAVAAIMRGGWIWVVMNRVI